MEHDKQIINKLLMAVWSNFINWSYGLALIYRFVYLSIYLYVCFGQKTVVASHIDNRRYQIWYRTRHASVKISHCRNRRQITKRKDCILAGSRWLLGPGKLGEDTGNPYIVTFLVWYDTYSLFCFSPIWKLVYCVNR